MDPLSIQANNNAQIQYSPSVGMLVFNGLNLNLLNPIYVLDGLCVTHDSSKSNSCIEMKQYVEVEDIAQRGG